MDIKLERPLAVFDIESTGVSPRADRIIELAIVRVETDEKRRTQVFRANPGIPIPEDATRIHGITDADVAECPTFPEIAPAVHAAFEGCDLCGYNILRFDIPMLTEEFLRAGLVFETESRNVLDVQRIYHRREPRDLTAALAFYCGELHLDAHGAEPDALAVLRVLEGQFARYPDLPTTLPELDEYCNPRDPSWVDKTGRLKWEKGNIMLNFGRKKGMPLRTIIEKDSGFIKWMLRSDFPLDTRKIVEDASNGIWPEPPGADHFR